VRQLLLTNLGVTSTAAELNVLDGIPATLTPTEIGYVDGVTSAIQTQLDAKGTVSNLADLSITSTAAELNKLDAVSRGSLIYGNPSAETAILTKGTANQVLTSDGTDIAWANAAAGGTDGWELISTITPTAATTISALNIISSSYEAVRIIVSRLVTSGTFQNNSASGAGNGFDMRLATSGSADSGTNYGALENSKDQIDGGNSFQISKDHHTINGQWIWPNGDGFNGEILITGLQRGSGINKNIYARTTIESANTWFQSVYSIGVYNGGTVTGIQFFTEGATATYVATGEIKVYGLKAS
jgi:hypothetical protein